MSESRASAAIERLPWLDDEPKGSKGKSRAGLKRWVPALALVGVAVAAGAYWLGRETGSAERRERPDVAIPIASGPGATMNLPEARKTIEEVAASQAPAAAPPAEARRPTPPPPVVRGGRIDIRRPLPKAQRSAPVERGDSGQPYWPTRTSAGASGRMVRIGTFASRSAAREGWRAIMGIYPGMRRIPYTVVPIPSARDGKTYYRLQMGTTSQAHSEVLCQRMRIIGQSCVVVGLGGAKR